MRFTRLSKNKRLKIVHFFIEDVGASTAARLLSLNRKTVNTWYRELRIRLLPLIPGLPHLRDTRAFRGYHERRISKLNGLFPKMRNLHILESRIRFQLKSRFKSAVLEAAEDLLA